MICACRLGFSVGTQDSHNLVDVEFLHLVTGGAQIFTRVKLTGLVVEDLADGGGHCKTAVGVDVDLADSALGGLAELLLRNTYCIREFAAKLVDDVHILLRDGAGTMENDGEAGELLLNLMEHVECVWWSESYHPCCFKYR